MNHDAGHRDVGGPSRRDILAGLIAALCAPATSLAGDPSPDLEAERAALLAEVQERLLGFDVAALVVWAATAIDLPPKHLERTLAAFGARDGRHGLRSVRALFDDPVVVAALREVADGARRDLRVLVRLRRALRRLPESADALAAALDGVAETLFGLDLPALRAHVARYPAQDMAVIYGPVTRTYELAGLLLHEPFMRLLELAHGRRATVVLPTGWPESVARMLEVLLDPEVRVACFVGHGTWSTFTLSGVFVHPDAAWEAIARRGRSDPRGLAEALADGSASAVLQRGRRLGSELHEDDLAVLARQHGPVPGGRKELVVRYTCGYDRYATDGDLLWLLAPPALDAQMSVRGRRFSSRAPSDVGSWEAGLLDWLEPLDVVVTEAPALGTCLVDDPSRTRGYEGTAWIDDYVADPLPAPLVDRVGVAPAAPAGEPGATPEEPR